MELYCRPGSCPMEVGSLIAIVTGGAILTVRRGLHPRSQIFGPAMIRGPGVGKVFLTFDDGPAPGLTDRYLKVLADAHAKATFFMIGERVRKAPGLAREVASEGHIIGNHSHTHRRLYRIRYRDVSEDLTRAHEAIRESTGKVPTLFRAPYGHRTPAIHRAARELGYTTVAWSLDPKDWRDTDHDLLLRRVLNRVRGGAIVLLHDGAATGSMHTLAVMPKLFDGIAEAGLECVGIHDVIG